MKLFIVLGLLVCAMGRCPVGAAPPQTPGQTGISEVHLERGGCHGSCPVDRVILRRDGTASYIGKMYVDRIGQYKGVFNPKDFYRLSAFVQGQGFFALEDQYNPRIEDANERTTTVIRRNAMTTVHAKGAEKPRSLWNIETAILGVAAGVKWQKDETGLQGRAVIKIKPNPKSTSASPQLPDGSPANYPLVIVKRASDKREITRQRADADGRFLIPLLSAGTYLLVPVPSEKSRPYLRGKPQTVTVKTNVTTPVVLEFDAK